jgi:acetyl esterase/lipase
MIIRHCLLFICISLVVGSCKKETTNTNNEVAASTFLNVAYGTDPLQKMDVYLPAGRTTASTKVLIMIHGGGWATGDKVDFGAFVDSLKKRLPGYALFNINYRLSSMGTNVFPTQELDVKKAVEYIYGKRSEYLTSDNFSLVGASAGGHLSLLHAYKYASPVKIKVVLDFFGPSDMVDLYNNSVVVSQANVAFVIGGTPSSNPTLYEQSTPLNFITTSAACPTIILQGSADPLVNAVRQSGALRDKLIAQSVPVQYVEYAGKGHGDDWYSDTYFDAFNKIQAFIAQYNP